MGKAGFTKHPFKPSCLEFQVYIRTYPGTHQLKTSIDPWCRNMVLPSLHHYEASTVVSLCSICLTQGRWNCVWILGIGCVNSMSECGCNLECQSQLKTRDGRVVEWYIFLSCSGVPHFSTSGTTRGGSFSLSLSEWGSTYLSIKMIYPSIYLSVCLSVCLSVYLIYIYNILQLYLYLYSYCIIF